MNRLFLISAACLIFAACSQKQDSQQKLMTIDQYPITEKQDSNLNFFGTNVYDPYLWLEDDTSAATGKWVDAQIALTRSYLDSIPFRTKLKDRYRDLFNFEKVGQPYKAGESYFIFKNAGLEPQGKIFVRNGLQGQDELFLDIDALSTDGTVSAELLGDSDDHKYMAVSISEAGSDWTKIVVYDIATKQPLADELRWVKFSGAAWYKDGFFYSRYPEPQKGKELSGNNEYHTVYYHKLGTPQSADKMIYRDDKRPHMYNSLYLTEDKKYTLLVSSPGTDGAEIWYKETVDEKGAFKPLLLNTEEHNAVLDNTPDGRMLLLTDVDAPRYKLVSIDPKNPAKENWQTLLPESEDLLQGVSTGGGKLFASYLSKATTRIYQFNYDGTGKKEIKLPDNTGSAGGFSGKITDTKLFYSFTSFTYTGSIYLYDIATGESTEFYSPKVKFNPADYESKQVVYKSKDGTEVTMFIVHKKGLKMDGNNPTLLYGYGGFNISLTPSFSTSRMILLENGGVFAMANLRGGGEYGEDWHKGGMLDKKQNVFDDFIAAAEYLISKGYTKKEMLGIEGGSNGGLLVGACMTQRPELFKVAFPAVGVLDMLRYHKFTIGKGWIPEYGCADSSEVAFKYLYAYSPYHNLKKDVAYPATMVMTADHDDRVVPAHSFKFAARLQEYHKGPHPVLIRIEKSAGHGAGKSTEQIIEEQADKWSFFFYNLGMKL